MIDIEKLKQVGKEWQKNEIHRIYFDVCKMYGVDPKHVKSGEEGRIARELMAAKLWYDVKTGEFIGQGLADERKNKIIAEIRAQVEEAKPEIKEEKTETEEFTAVGKPVPTLNRMPETIEEIEVLMKAEGMTEFKSKVLFLQGVLRAKQIHNIDFSDVEKYQKLFIEYLNQEKQKEDKK